jgi:cation diffusion facilitator family transporter
MSDTSTLQRALIWLGFSQPSTDAQTAGAHGQAGSHGHTHGVIDATIATTDRGIWAIKWSFSILAVTALFQLGVVAISGSVALLADTIHNLGDAVTAIPLWIAFRLARRPATKRFTYGYGRVEDLAGVSIVLIILASALVALYQAVDRLLHPQPIQQLLWVALAGLVGFIGNEIVAVFRIRVGREINSAALIADGYHARTDGFTSLAVVFGAAGVWLGFPLADPIIGLLITLAIFGIVWQSSKAVFTRMLDGVEPHIIDEINHAAAHVPGVSSVLDVKARWVGHRLVAELDIGLAGATTVAQVDGVAAALEHELLDHLPALKSVRIRVRSTDSSSAPATSAHAHGAPDPVPVRGRLASGRLSIVDTPHGERVRFEPDAFVPSLKVWVVILRPGGEEVLTMVHDAASGVFESVDVPAEPHEFTAELQLQSAGDAERLPFAMSEPHAH